MVELLFMMLILKLPILYLAGVCYWAIKAEPEPRPLAQRRPELEPGDEDACDHTNTCSTRTRVPLSRWEVSLLCRSGHP